MRIAQSFLLVILVSSMSHANPTQDVFVIAHRGASAHAPENTVAAVKEAVRIGSDAIEIDLQMTIDGVLVALHDSKVNRTTDGRGRLTEMSFEAVRRLDAGSWFGPQFAGERIPTLDEIIDVLGETAVLIIEFKVGADDAPGIEAKVVERIRERGIGDRVILKAFDRSILERLAERAPELPRLYVYAIHLSWIRLTVDSGVRFGGVLDTDATWLQPHRALLGRRFVARAQQAGYRVVAWDVHTPKRMRKMLDYGVDAIETDYPGQLLEMVGRSNPSKVGAASAAIGADRR